MYVRHRVDGEPRFTRRSRKLPGIADRIGEIEAARFVDPCCIVFVPGDDLADEMTNLVVIVNKYVPVDVIPWPIFILEGGLRQAGDNIDFTFEQFRYRLESSLRGLDDAHGVFRGDILGDIILKILVGASKRGQDQGLGSGDKVGPVEFGGDVDGEAAAGKRLRGIGCIRRGREEIAAEGDEDLRLSCMHGLDASHRVMTSFGGWLKVADLFEAIQKFRRGVFGDAHGAIALHIAMPTDGAGACAWFSDVAPQQEEIDDFLHVGHGVFMLGHAHGPGTDDTFGLFSNIRGFLNVFAGNAAAFLNFLP